MICWHALTSCIFFVRIEYYSVSLQLDVLGSKWLSQLNKRILEAFLIAFQLDMVIKHLLHTYKGL